MNEQTHSSPASPFSWRQQAVFTLKELRETLRDRRTIITLLSMPILLYPLLGMAFRTLAIHNVNQSQPEYFLAFASLPEANWFQEVFQRGERFIEQERQQQGTRQAADATVSVATPQSPQLKYLVPEEQATFDLPELIRSGVADVGIQVRFADRSIWPDFPTGHIELLVGADSARGQAAAAFLNERSRACNEQMITGWASQQQLPFRVPLQEQTVYVAASGNTNALLSLLPLVMLLMTVTGGVYPAIDLTAGERERDTLETLMTLPVPRYRLLWAKFVAVVTVTLLTGLMNLLAMSVTVYALQLEELLFGSQGLTLLLMTKLCLVLMIFAIFYATVLLLLTCTARSFKEAQAYLIPLLLISTTPGIVILMPGWELNAFTAVLPLMNLLLLARELLEGTAQLLPAAMALLTTCGYGMACLAVAARLFGEDAVSAGGRGPLQELFSRPVEASERPTLSAAVMLLAVLFPLYFVCSGLLGRLPATALTARMLSSGLLTVLLFAGLPLLLLWRQRIPWRTGVSLQRPEAGVWPGALLLGLTTWPLVFEVVVLMNSWNLAWLGEQHFAQVEELLAAWQQIPFPVVLLVLGILPGICEELFFRGFLFNGLRGQLGPVRGLIFAAIAFGLFHVVVAGGAAPERVVPSTLLGILLGWVAWQAGSVWPAMLLHVLHNSTLLTLARYQQQLTWGPLGSLERQHLPWPWLIASASCLLVGLIVIHRNRTNSATSLNSALT